MLEVENDCAMAGHPVSGGSSGSSDGLFGTSLGSGASATDFASTATGLGGLGGTAAGGAGPTATSIGKGSGSGSGISFGGSSAMGLTAQIGAVAAAVVSVVILTV
ncbi:hypothetical protein AX14_011231 [Amanita brunnescens Koide BX004]|jgi:hypothetical protein|nr:hypothetical protein AX14_011231 [Amanita brunnescens Koide BX004]